jgi:hypothetical protein
MNPSPVEQLRAPAVVAVVKLPASVPVPCEWALPAL